MSRIWPNTLLGRNALLLIGAITISQITAVLTFVVFVQAPRVKDAAGLLAAQILTVQRLLSALPDQSRASYIAVLGGQGAPPPTTPEAGAQRWQPLARYETRRFMAQLQAHLPANISLRLDPAGSRMWVGIPVSAEQYWIALPVERSLRQHGVWIAITVSGALSLLGVLIAYLIHRRINRPLRQLVSAADVLGNGEQPEPVSLGRVDI